MQFSKRLLIGSVLLNVLLITAMFFIVQRLGGMKYMVHRLNNKDIAGIYEHRKGFFEMLPKKMGGIIFLGDSLTEYGQWSELTQNEQVINRGIAGDTSPNLLRRLEPIIAAAPSKIFLMIGVNDFLFFDRQEILVNYKKVLTRLQQDLPNTEIYIQSILPINPTIRNMAFENKEIRLLNKSIVDLSEAYNMTYIDIHSLLVDAVGNLDKQYTKDGVHLNGRAYQIWLGAIQSFL